MKKLQKTFSVALLTAIISLLLSCDAKIGVADEYKVVFWFDESTSRQFMDDGAETLTFYINDYAVATSLTDDIFWEYSPECKDSTAIVGRVHLLKTDRYIVYRVKDQTGFEYWNSVQSLETPCSNIKIGPLKKLKEKIVH